MPAKLDALEHKLLASVNDGERPERVLEAVQAVRALRELRQEQKKPKQSWSAASVALTPVFAMLITAATLLIQTHENNRNAEFQQDQAESAAWRDTLSNVYLDDPNSVQMCLFSLQGFLDSRSRYASEARSIAVALLPLTANENGFDFIFSKLERQTTKSNQQDLFAIARKVRYQEEDLMAAVAKGSAGKPGACTNSTFPNLFFAADRCFDTKYVQDTTILNRVWLYAWETDSVSQGLAKLWKDQDGAARPRNTDLSGILLEDADLSTVDFTDANLTGTIIHDSNLSGAHFDRAQLGRSVFHDISNFSASTWNRSNWWSAADLPCGLVLWYINK